ncbi:MAG: HAMP domain-containing histidine kinase [Anaerolineales bacterium]|nr:HAMP domain-containing histidine kinase [Anaerolineales bacterium]
MQQIELLQKIKPYWIDQVSHRLARGELVRVSFVNQLNIFFDLLFQALFTGDPAWLNTVLDDWIASRTQSELEQQGTSITHILNHILLATHEIVQKELNSKEGLALLGAILPIYTHAFEYTAQKEAQLHIDHISSELDKARIILENLDKSKSDFIAVAAHELKTPLTLIEGYTSMLKEQYSAYDHESNSFIYLKGMDNGIHRLNEIVNDMIDVSMIDNDMLKLNFQPVWIKQLFGIAEHELARYVNERSQILEIIYFDGCEDMTYGDPERLYQAVRNILTNAIKYTPDGGKISVNGRKLPGFIEIIIADTGIGIDEAYHEQIFEKFGSLGNVKLHSSGKTKFKGGGPGLGLSITKGLIEAHGGAIWIESEGYNEVECPGTTFHVLLPIVKEPPDKKIAKLFQSLNDSTTI